MDEYGTPDLNQHMIIYINWPFFKKYVTYKLSFVILVEHIWHWMINCKSLMLTFNCRVVNNHFFFTF